MAISLMKERSNISSSTPPLSRTVPPLIEGIVPRARLDTLSEEVVRLPLTLLVAAGGFGKTTLLLAWYQNLCARAPAAWITLFPEDLTLSSLVQGLLEACVRAFPDAGGSVRELLEHGASDPRAMAAALSNELYVATEEAACSFALFIDDGHAIAADPLAQEFASAFLQSLPPRVHVVVASRGSLSFAPIAKFRNAGRLLEIDEAALRFRSEEALALVADVDTADALVRQTEGWPIAVNLTARLARAGGGAYMRALPEARDAVFAFLAEEVVALLDQDFRELLGPLAIPATLDVEVVERLLERHDGASILARMAARSLYITRTSDETWRLHDLFREFLLGRMRVERPEREREIRRRYATLLRERGDKVAALGQLIEAGDLVEIVEYVEEAVVTIRFTDRYRRLLELLSRLPEDVKNRKPVLLRFYAIALQRAGRWDEADHALHRCLDAAVAAGDDALACLALLERGIGMGSLRFRTHGRHEQNLQCFRQALVLAEGPSLRDRPAYRKLTYEVLGLTSALRFDYDEAMRWLAQAETLELAEPVHRELVFVEIARVHAWTGDWERALEYAELAEEYFRVDAPFHVGYAQIVQAKALAALRRDLERATKVALEAIESLHESFEDEELGSAYEALATVLLARDEPDVAGVLAACAQGERYVDSRNRVVRAELALVRARVAAIMRNTADWERAIRDAERLAASDDRLSTRIRFERERGRQMRFGAPPDAAPFDEVASSFAEQRDRYYAAAARIAAACAALAAGAPVEHRLRETIAVLSQEPAEAAALEDVSSAQRIASACLRFGIEVHAATLLLGRVGIDIAVLRELLADQSAHVEGRLAALRLVVASPMPDLRPMLATLAEDACEPLATLARSFAKQSLTDVVPSLRISVIPGVSVAVGDIVVNEGDPRWGRRKAAELLRLLAISGGPVAKGAAIAALWPDAYSGHEGTLRVAAHALRRALQMESGVPADYVIFDAATIGLKRSLVESIDVETAFGQLQRGKHLAGMGDYEEATRALEAAAQAFLGAPKESAAPVWLAPHVRRWNEAALDALRALTELHLHEKRLDEALGYVRRAIALDLLDEPTVAIAMESFIQAKRFSEGRALFARYKRRLAETLNTTPGPEMIERYKRLFAGRDQERRMSLSEREREILQLVAAGRTSKEIAALVGLSAFTVNNHVSRIMKKLHVESRAAAVAYLQSEASS